MKQHHLLSSIIVAGASLTAQSGAATLLLHYGMGEEGSIDTNHHLVSTVPGEPGYTMGNVYPGGTNPVVSDVSGIPGSTKAASNISQYGANATDLGTKLSDSSAGGDGSYMLSFWINTAAAGAEQTILYTGGNNFKFYLNKNLEFAVSKNGYTSKASGLVLTAGEWANLAVYYDASAKTYTFAMNGVTGNAISYGEAAVWGSNMHLGLYSGGGSRLNANTMLDEMKIYRMESGDDFATMATNEFRYGNALIPEASTATLGLAGMVLLLARRRRRQ